MSETQETMIESSEKKQKTNTLEEIFQLMDELEQSQREFQNAYNNMNTINRTLKKTLQKFVKKEYRRRRGRKNRVLLIDGEEKSRKPCGFELPTNISDELCAFIGCAPGVKIPRTEVSKLIAKYISDNNLKNPEKKRVIIPDAKLSALLGPEAKGQELTHFNMNKFLKHHFPPKKL